LLLDVSFNREVAEDSTLYWSKTDGNLAGMIESADAMDGFEIESLGKKAEERIINAYNWEKIVKMYERVFL